MSKTEKKAAEEVVKVDVKDVEIPSLETLESINEMERNFSLNAEYLKMEEGENIRVFTFQNTEMVDRETGEISPAVHLMTPDKKILITASNMIVDTCKSLPAFTPLEIEYEGQKDMGKGKKLNVYKIFSLRQS